MSSFQTGSARMQKLLVSVIHTYVNRRLHIIINKHVSNLKFGQLFVKNVNHRMKIISKKRMKKLPTGWLHITKYRHNIR